MLKLQGKELCSERLRYRLLRTDDYDRLRQLLSDETLTIPAGYLPAASEEEFTEFWRYLTKEHATLGIWLGDELIGYLHVKRVKRGDIRYLDARCVSSGFVFDRRFHGMGYATEALTTVTGYIKKLFSYCYADCFEDNPASRRVIEKSGYHYYAEEECCFDEIQQVKKELIFVCKGERNRAAK